VHRVALFSDDSGKVPSPVDAQTKSSSNTKQRKTGIFRWKRELRILYRQRWSWKQKKAIMRAMRRLQDTTGTLSAIVFIPETYNASTYATSGDYADFIRAWSAGLEGMRERKETKLHVSVTELLERFDKSSSSCCIGAIDSMLSACSSFCPDEVLTEARHAVEVEIALHPSAEFIPTNTRFAKCILSAIEEYVKDSASTKS
jgi:hypothetical protein